MSKLPSLPDYIRLENGFNIIIARNGEIYITTRKYNITITNRDRVFITGYV